MINISFEDVRRLPVRYLPLHLTQLSRRSSVLDRLFHISHADDRPNETTVWSSKLLSAKQLYGLSTVRFLSQCASFEKDGRLLQL